jgi:hypothetical protein
MIEDVADCVKPFSYGIMCDTVRTLLWSCSVFWQRALQFPSSQQSKTLPVTGLGGL